MLAGNQRVFRMAIPCKWRWLTVNLLAMLCLQPKLVVAEIVVAGANSWQTSGLCSFRTGTGTNTAIHLAKYADGKFGILFTKEIRRPVHPPICLTNGVIVVSSDGEIRKLDLRGEFAFVDKPKGFTGAAGHSGKLSDNSIFLTETIRDKRGKDWLYELYVLDISGVGPSIKEKHRIPQPIAITKAGDEVVIVGTRHIKRIKLSVPDIDNSAGTSR